MKRKCPLALTADNSADLNAKAASVSSAHGALVTTAGGTVDLAAGETTRSVDEAHQVTGRSSAFSKKTITTRDTVSETAAQGTTFSANTTYVQSNGDINVKGSHVVSTEGTALVARNDVNIEAATNTVTEAHFRDEKKSGLFGSGGIGFTIGTQQQSSDAKNTRDTAAASTVGATHGDVNIQAGNAYKQVGSNVIAPQGDIDITARKVDITEAKNANQAAQQTKFKQSGLTVALTTPVVNAIQTAAQMKGAASQTSDKRLEALAGASTALAAKSAYDAVSANPSQAGGVNISISVGSSKSQSNAVQTGSFAARSVVSAGGNLNITAAGANHGSDITVQGSTIAAGNNATLKADDEINLLAAKNTSEQRSTNKSSSASIGVSFGTDGFLVNASASGGRGKADGSDVTWTNTHVDAGDRLTLESGGNTALRGAVATGKKVDANIGGDLNIESLQDTSTYESKQQNIGGSISVGAGKMGGSVNYGKSNMNSQFASVGEQSGIKAGDDGFAIDVKGNTDLNGGLIASSGQAVKDGTNSLTTATLTQRDIQNRASASANSSGINLSSDMLSQGKYGAAKAVVGAGLDNGKASGSSSGTTRSAVQAGVVTITNEAAHEALTGVTTEKTIASLNRDTAAAHSGAQQQDVLAMQRTAQAEQAIKRQAFKEVTVHTDAAYKAMFQTNAKFYRVTCQGTQAQCLNDPKHVHMEEITDVEAKRDGKVLAVNGILNDAPRAGQLAYQNAPVDDITKEKPSSISLIHIAPADTGLGEVVVAGYEKMLAPTLGYTNADLTYAEILQGRGNEETLAIAHSRGAIIQRNAFNASADNGYENKKLVVDAVGGGVGVQAHTDAAARIIGGAGIGNVTFSYMTNDPVPVIAAGNPGEVWAALKEFYNVVLSNNSAHSCYGTGTQGCATIANPVPGGPVPTNQKPGTLQVYRGGKLVSPEPVLSEGTR